VHPGIDQTQTHHEGLGDSIATEMLLNMMGSKCSRNKKPHNVRGSLNIHHSIAIE
jgi:hypothetical protein